MFIGKNSIPAYTTWAYVFTTLQYQSVRNLDEEQNYLSRKTIVKNINTQNEKNTTKQNARNMNRQNKNRYKLILRTKQI